ncbi:MAG: hypothetical protein CGU28_00290 [Candidatus Dactylopiibacterium carminicum]|uniref:SCP domain-containing protein n=1 Tax=Candidatus Dactylopiibacterium carminicum TaxID=857335 RepID=A0A272EZ17_9RHOO|nr:CAP domain-containing protein [Candidatus Dactylopiibacterium carminicum]KAF7600860.1 hypothetical protein BGI27_00485 [Candidatus Dactylopiibacterium carminicum]PAS95359.1 MAG: hypothetical protein CGU29_00520 [Candidatus Dactylopiibacterium carminicum]PAS98631.1 MAG: hypothetical protein CGU28_00290 [Candidatus Dactylopiibacterium carminicum]PAT00862.1 MAG: hypothetical protein BSR46_00485 [Candidatus Dactylopiibacterium carminicum]
MPQRPFLPHLPLLLTSLLLSLAACGGGGGDIAETAAPAGASSTSSATASHSSSARSSTSAGSQSSSSSSQRASSVSSASVYATLPSVAGCSVGALNDSERTAVLARLNGIRDRHGLPSVSYDSSDDSAAAQAAMYMVANRSLTHTPSGNGNCYTSEASRLAGTSNLYYSSAWGSSTLSQASTEAIRAYLIDENVSSLGHRRWVLFPFMGATAFGRVDDVSGSTSYMASTLRTIGGERTSVSSMAPDFVAYPHGDYPVSDFAKNWYLSFSAIASKTDRWANGSDHVSFANATIAVSDASGNSLSASDVSHDYSGYGLANSLQWKLDSLQDNVTYTVRIDNVLVNGGTRNYEYSFRLQ